MSEPGFLLAESAALKNRLRAIAVSDDKNAERVAQVFFRYPEGETEKLYPFITIDLVDVAFAPNRQESERTYYYTNAAGASIGLTPNIDYYPSEMTSDDLDLLVDSSSYIYTDQFVAVDLMYQVTTHCRSARHDMQMSAKLLRRVFPLRRGFIDIPEDGTVRRCDLLDWRSADVLDQETGYKKRVFRKVYTVRINAEIPQSDFESVLRALEVQGTVSNYDPASPVLLNPITEEF